MSRTRLSPIRLIETRRQNLGKIILYCEGKSEKYYFDYFAEIINKARDNKYDSVVVETESANGNARTVLDFANNYLSDEVHNRQYAKYGKYLVFDCDDPKDIRSVILDASSCASQYTLLISNHFFETWLLMHFEEVDERLTKRQTYRRLSEHLSAKYEKGRKGRTREIIANGDIEKAIECAKRLCSQYDEQQMTIFDSIDDMNPYTTVHTLVEQLMLLIS